MPLTLNPRQLQAIAHVHGPMLVVAGAGTGKTTVLVQRIARLIRERFARPDEILALTFTDNAAQEMASRVRAELNDVNCSGLQASTFHAYCHGLLERNGRSFRVLEPQDLWIYLRGRIRELPLRYYAPARNPGEFLDTLLEFFERCKDELVDAAAFRTWVEKLPQSASALPRVAKTRKLAEMPQDEQVERWQEIAAIYSAVEGMLAKDNLGTFGHQITRAIEVLRGDAVLLQRAQAEGRFLLIDEFQDVNVAQIVLAQLLAGDERNVFAVGDPDQAIYRFRGASAAAFQEFARRFPETRSVILSDNQRSRTPILKCAFSAISNNPPVHCVIDGSGKCFEREALVSARDQKEKGRRRPSPTVEIVSHSSSVCEAADAVDAIERRRSLPRGGDSHVRFGILYRAHGHRAELVKELADRGIPFAVTGINALETAEVRDLLACLRVIVSHHDSGSLFRMAALPVFHVDPEPLRAAMAGAPRGTEFASLLAKLPGGDEVLAAVEELRAHARSLEMDPRATLMFMFRRFSFDTSQPAVQAFFEFVSQWREKPIVRSGKLPEFVEYMDWLSEAHGMVEVPAPAGAHDPDVVQLMTVHAAKGLEFEHVFVVHLDQGSFPVNNREHLFEFPPELRKGMAPLGEGREIHKQEERRLFYVGMTRARESLTLSARLGKGKDTRPRAFVRELMSDRGVSEYWREREASLTLEIAAAAAAPAVVSGVGKWLVAPIPDPPLPGSLSATAIERYETCPLQFKIARDWKLPGRVAGDMQFGTVMHTVLRDYFESVRAGRPKNVEQVLECLRATLADMPFEDAYQRELYQQEGTEELRELVRLRECGPPIEVLATERTFTFAVGGVRVTGRVDRIDRIDGHGVRIVDYKTGNPRQRPDADKSLQLSLYALAARELWDYLPQELVFYNLKDNSTAVSTRSEEELRDEQERVLKVAEGIADGHFDAKPGYHCRRCAYRSFCPYTEERVYAIQRAELAAGVS